MDRIFLLKKPSKSQVMKVSQGKVASFLMTRGYVLPFHNMGCL